MYRGIQNMKTACKLVLQRLLGFENYLFAFSIFKILTFRLDRGENEIFRFIAEMPKTGVVLDIGANIGITTGLIKLRRPHVSVVGFEPMPCNVKAWQRVVKLFRFSGVQLFPFAIGERKGQASLVLPVIGGVRMQGLSHVRHESIRGYKGKEECFSVTMERLDDLGSLWNNRPVAAIKIDVENFEQFVICGARQLLSKDRPVIYCELWDNDNRRNCLSMLDELGYVAKVVRAGILTKFDPMIDRNQNFFFFPEKQFDAAM